MFRRSLEFRLWDKYGIGGQLKKVHLILYQSEVLFFSSRSGAEWHLIKSRCAATYVL